MSENSTEVHINKSDPVSKDYSPQSTLSYLFSKIRSEISTKFVIAVSAVILSYLTFIWSGMVSYVDGFMRQKVISFVNDDIADVKNSSLISIIGQRLATAEGSELNSRIKTMIDVALRQDVGALTT